MKNTLFYLFLAGFVSIIPALKAAATPVKYKVIDLGALSPEAIGDERGQHRGHSYAFDINNNNQVVGWSTHPPNQDTIINHAAFLWQNGTMMDFGLFDYAHAFAVNNDASLIAGRAADHGDVAFIKDAGGIKFLDPEPINSRAFGVNDKGQAVGYEVGGGGSGMRAYIWENDVYQILNTQDPSFAFDINNKGQVAGSMMTNAGPSAFLWEDGVLTDLGLSESASISINDHGQIAGTSEFRAFLWEAGSTVDIGIIDGMSYSFGRDVNEKGQVVGYSSKTSSNYTGGGYFPWHDGFTQNAGTLEDQAFLWDNGSLFNLNDLIDPAAGWNLTQAMAINDYGYIVGRGINPEGSVRAYMAKPVPEPATGLLLITGILGLAGLARRKAVPKVAQ